MAFKRFDPEDFVVSSDSITSTLWSTGNPTLTNFFTSSNVIHASRCFFSTKSRSCSPCSLLLLLFLRVSAYFFVLFLQIDLLERT